MPTSPAPIPFANRLIAWQRQRGRHDLPWQNTRDPYRIWLSEVMLQQTQVTTVIPYYQRFLERFPDLAALAAAHHEEVMALWSGLGYYARARNLHACAHAVMAEHGGVFPRAPEAIARLPGIGRSTANAIAVFCFGARQPILDGNVKRLLCRHGGVAGFPGLAKVEKQLWILAHELLPENHVGTYIQAQMDLGATVCTRHRPRCEVCPVSQDCQARLEHRTGELPASRPNRVLPERETTILLLIHDGRVLIEARPSTGIWGGLWSLPEIAGPEAANLAAELLGCRITSMQSLASVRHNLTHFRLNLKPLMCEAQPLATIAEPGLRWLTRDELEQAPLPAPIRRLLAGLDETDLSEPPR